MNEEKSIRAFLAIELPTDIINEIHVIQSRLRKLLPGTVRWVRPEGIHLTLKFFGDVSENDIVKIKGDMEDQVRGAEPFALDVETLGVFPDLNRPRVIWLGMGGDVERLIRFQKSMDQKLHESGFEKENRSFQPHLTLARIKDPKSVIGLAKIVEKMDKDSAGHFDAMGLTLFRSQLTPGGAVYSKLAWFPFSR
jgi:RNA 2',3'-cyclic 3'-phosphodiesterase